MLHMRYILVFACCTMLLLGLMGCASKTVTVIDENSFLTMTKRLAPILYEHQILDSNGQYVESLVPIAQTFLLPDDMGKVLFTNLAHPFHDQMTNALQHVSVIPESFAATQNPEDTVTLFPYGFVMAQKDRTITVQLLAITDWNGDGLDDYLIIACLEIPKNKDKRDYYLVVEDINAQNLRGRTLAMYNYKTGEIHIYEGATASDALDLESLTIEVEAGTRPVTLPRDTTVKSRGDSEKALSE